MSHAPTSNPLDWLLEDQNPSVRYRTLTELLGEDPADPQVRQTKAQIATSRPVSRIFARMNPEGYWYYFDKQTNKGMGDGVEYWGWITTHFNLAFLSELGMDKDDPRLSLAAARYLDLQQPDGDFLGHYSCLYAYNLRSFIRMGYQEDLRVKRTRALMLATERVDGGYLCDSHEGKYKTKPAKSCIRGSVKALMAFAELPDLWDTPRCQALVSYFLRRRVYFQTRRPTQPVLREMTATVFPFNWRATLLEALYALSVLGYGQAPELTEAWDQLETRRDENGRYVLDWAPSRSYFKPDQQGKPSKWVTLYACLALKHRETARRALPLTNDPSPTTPNHP